MRCSVDTPGDMQVVEGIARDCIQRHGLHFTWHDVWSVVTTGPQWRIDRMIDRNLNAAYVAQVAAERGIASETLTWQEVRYNLHTGREF